MAMKLLFTVEAASVKEEEVTVTSPLQSSSRSLAIIVFALEGMLWAFFLTHSFKFIVLETSAILETLSLVLAMLAACLVILELPHKVSTIGKDKSPQSLHLALSEGPHE